MKQLHIFFSGQVQGVGFRATAYYFARELNLVGFVKNLPDGRVELMAQGEEENLKKLIEELKNRFPSKTEIQWHKNIQNQYQDFDILLS